MKAIGQAIEGVLEKPAESTAIAPRRPDGPEPAQPKVIAGWLLRLVKTRMGGKPASPGDLSEEIADIVFALGDRPAGCWTDETLREAKAHFEFWPGPAQLRKFLDPIADTMRTRHRNDTAGSIVPARESPVPYRPKSPLLVEQAPRRRRHGPPPPSEDVLDVIDEAAIERTLRVLGYSRATLPPLQPRVSGVTSRAANDRRRQPIGDVIGEGPVK